MKKLLALALTLALLLSLFSVASAEKAPGSVNLSIMLALGQWTDNFDELIEAYKAENPQIGTIEYEFPSSSVYWDLLKSKLASGEVPDIFGCGFGEQIVQWNDYLADLSDMDIVLWMARPFRCSPSMWKAGVFSTTCACSKKLAGKRFPKPATSWSSCARTWLLPVSSPLNCIMPKPAFP